MAANYVFPVFPVFTDVDGDPLEAGYLYIGDPNVDPENNQKSVFWDRALSIPADWPIRTIGGYPSRNGSPGSLYVDGDYSITVRNKNGTLVYSSLTTSIVIGSSALNSLIISTSSLDAYSELRGLSPSNYEVGDVVYVSGDGIAGEFKVMSGTATDNGGTIITNATWNAASKYWQRLYNGVVEVSWFGGRTHTEVQAAIDALTASLTDGGGKVRLERQATYTFTGGITLGTNIHLDCNKALINHNDAGGVAITMGTSDSNLTYSPKVTDLIFKHLNPDSTCILMRGTNQAIVRDCYIEGYTTPIDNTRTHIGILIDGRDVSSYFNTVENVDINHAHFAIKVTSTGLLDPTDQMFHNVTILGDQSLDNLSIGYWFVGNGISNFAGEGSVINGGNVELFNTGFLVDADAGRVPVNGTRTELNITGTAWKFDFVNGSGPWILLGVRGLGTTYMDSASGIRNFDANAGNMLIGGDNGEIRMGGFSRANNNRHFIGMRDGSGANAPQLWFAENSDVNVLVDSDNTGTGRIVLQAGRGSSDQGAGFIAHSHAANPNPGMLDLFYSNGATNAGVRVTSGLGGTERFFINSSIARPGIDNSMTLGNGSFRFSEVFAANGTINTSDEREKTEVQSITDEILDAWSDVNFVQFKWIDALEKKGDESRIHFGVIAQQVKEAFEKKGIDPFKLGILCFDQWEESTITHLEFETDEDGNPIPEYIEAKDSNGDVVEDKNGNVIMIENGFKHKVISEVIAAGNRFGVRYSECMVLEMALLRRALKNV